MEKEFTKEYILSSRGCYSREEVEKLTFINQKRITLTTLLNGLQLKDFNWFLIRKCELTTEQKTSLALMFAETVLPIYEEKYPNDDRVSECIQGINDFNSGKINKEELMVLRRYPAAAAYADAYAYAYAYAADAYADAYAYAADAYAADAKWQPIIKKAIKNWIKKQK